MFACNQQDNPMRIYSCNRCDTISTAIYDCETTTAKNISHWQQRQMYVSAAVVGQGNITPCCALFLMLAQSST